MGAFLCRECKAPFIPLPRTRPGTGFCSARCRTRFRKSYRAEWMSRNTDASRRYSSTYRAKQRARCDREQDRLRRQMLDAYGRRCDCPGECGETREAFLTLDHIGFHPGRKVNSGGRKMGGCSEYRRLRRLGWPKAGLRILCMNCNWAIRIGARCPHEDELDQVRLKLRIVHG